MTKPKDRAESNSENVPTPVGGPFEPMSGMDAGFLYMETDALAMHTLKVVIIDPTHVADGVTFESFKRSFEKRLERIPPFRQRIAKIPLGLGHPIWIPDEDFDIGRHLCRLRSEEPGGMRELDAVISEFTKHALPRDRPLWRIAMVEGLEGGRIAFVAKLHHSLADGSAALELLMQVLREPQPDARPSEPQQEPTATMRDLMRLTGHESWHRFRTLPGLISRTVRGVGRIVRSSEPETQAAVPKPFSNPPLHFNTALTAERSYVSTSLSLDDIRRVKRELHVTVNDVIVAICGGALRAYLEARGELPDQPVIASIPINTQPQLTGRLRGNHVGNLLTSLCTDIADPVERLQAIAVTTRASKRQMQTMGSDIYERWFDYTPPVLYSAAVRIWSRNHLSNRFRAPMNLVVSNVRGPGSEISIAGVRIESLYSVGPVLDGVGLNITGWSYAGRMNLVALACTTNFPDLRSLVDRFDSALQELLDACRSESDEASSQDARSVDEPTKPSSSPEDPSAPQAPGPGA